ncbi:MAG TPA: DUF6279 family lipoprotein [Burkholderiales bacterium]|nr:DUF6279 family lipoprotein [Burkholderiales bacterium]
MLGRLTDHGSRFTLFEEGGTDGTSAGGRGPSVMNFSFSAFTRLVAACSALLGLAGCMSMVGFGYSQADHIAAWKADHYFDLDANQKEEFRRRFARFHAWHRRDQLPDYASFLASGRHRIERGLTPADVDWFAEGLRSRYRRMVRYATADAADLLATLTPAQIDNLEKQWQNDNRKFAGEHKLDGTPEERKRARARRTLSQIKDWTGSLSDTQEARIVALSNEWPDTEQARYDDRLRRQREFFQLLRGRRGDRQQFAARLTQWLSDWETGRDPEYQRASDAAWRKRTELYVVLARMLTPEQRTSVVRRLQNHIDEFRRLAQSGDAAAQTATSER